MYKFEIRYIPWDVGMRSWAPWMPCTSWPDASINCGIAAGCGAAKSCGGCGGAAPTRPAAPAIGNDPTHLKFILKCPRCVCVWASDAIQ